jgi:stage V sporulation protein G
VGLHNPAQGKRIITGNTHKDIFNIEREETVEITEVKITLRDEEKLKAFVSITFDNAFVVRGLKIISGSKGYFVSMPSRKRKDGSHQDIAHPINNDMRKQIEDIILDEYEKIKSKNLTEAKIKRTEGDETEQAEAPETTETTETPEAEEDSERTGDVPEEGDTESLS